MSTVQLKEQRCRIGSRVTILRRGSSWYVEWFAAGRQHRRALKTKNRHVAEARAREFEQQLIGTPGAGASSISLSQAVSSYLHYLQSEGRCAATLARYRVEYDRFSAFCKERGVAGLHRVDLPLLEDYRALRKHQGAAEKTRYHETIVIKQLLNWAHARQMVAENPLKALRLQKAKPRPQPCFTLEQVEAILAAASEPTRSALAILAFTGMRVGELQWLTWEDVDFARSVIQVRPKPGWRPKSGRARVVPMHPRVRSVLEQRPCTYRWVFTAAPSPDYPQGGHQLNPGHLLYKLKSILRRLGIPEGKLHTFRHFFISYCANNGVEPFKLMRWVGHSDLTVILGYYSLSDEESQRAMQRVSFRAQPGKDEANR